MRLSSVLRTAAVAGFAAFAAAAFFFPHSFASVHARAHGGTLWMVLSLLASACAAKLTFPITLFGLKVEIGAPVFLLLAFPYFVRLLIWDFVIRLVGSWFAARNPAPLPPPRPATYALPSRVAVALAAAARARR